MAFPDRRSFFIWSFRLAVCSLTLALGYGTAAAIDPGAVCQGAAKAALDKFKDKGLKDFQLAISLDLIDSATHREQTGDYHGDVAYYPSSVAKLFLLVYAGHLLQNAELKLTPELDRAAHDMATDSSNDAMSLVMDMATGTTSGPELSEAALEKWENAREAINRYFAGLGLTGINVEQKTWNEGPYGRERQFIGQNYENANSLSANMCAKLMSEIALGTVLPVKNGAKDWQAWIRDFIHRTIPADDPNADFESNFIGASLPKGSQLWSKAAYTGNERHDVAWVKLPDGKEFVLCVLTEGQSDNPDLIPFIAEYVVGNVEAG